jgi:hypothetical protein
MESSQVYSILDGLHERVARLESGLGAARFGKKTSFLSMQAGEDGGSSLNLAHQIPFKDKYRMFFFEGSVERMDWYEFEIRNSKLVTTTEEAVYDSFKSHPAIMFDNRESVAVYYGAGVLPFRGLLITGLYGMKPSSVDLGPVKKFEFSEFDEFKNIERNCRIILDLMRAGYQIMQSGDESHRIILTLGPLNGLN